MTWGTPLKFGQKYDFYCVYPFTAHGDLKTRLSYTMKEREQRSITTFIWEEQ